MRERLRKAGLRLSEQWLLPLGLVLLALQRTAADPGWHAFWMAREGLDLFSNSAFVHQDRWSWAPMPHVFVPTSPAWQVLLGAAWSVGGKWTLAAFSFMAVCACLVALAYVAHALGGTDIRILVTLSVVGYTASQLIVPRAALPALCLFILHLLWIWKYRARLLQLRPFNATLRCASVALLIAFCGIWIHGSWTAFVALIAASALFLFWRTPAATATSRLACAFATAMGSLVGTLSGPLGFTAWKQAAIVAENCRGLVLEWMTPIQLGHDWIVIWIAVFIAAAMTSISLAEAPRDDATDLRTVFAILAWCFLMAGLFAVRFVLTAIVFIGLLAATQHGHHTRLPIIASAVRWLRNRYSNRFGRAVAAGVLLALFPLVARELPSTYTMLDSTAIARIPSECRLFSADILAGAVVLERPDVSIWIDGRLDYWGRERLIQARDYFELRDPARLVPDGSECVLLPKEQRASKLVLALNRNPSWTRVTSDPTATLWVKST